jgi:hypothetical protein
LHSRIEKPLIWRPCQSSGRTTDDWRIAELSGFLEAAGFIATTAQVFEVPYPCIWLVGLAISAVMSALLTRAMAA